MICIDDFCNGETVSLMWVTVRDSSETLGSQHSRVERGRLHWQWPLLRKPWLMHFIIGLFTYAFKKDFKQPLLHKSESEKHKIINRWVRHVTKPRVVQSWVLLLLQSIFSMTRSAVIDKNLYKVSTSCSGWCARQLCVCDVSLWNLPNNDY